MVTSENFLCLSLVLRNVQFRDQYPVAQKHTDSYVCLVQTLRYPNGPEVTEMITEAFWKVMTQLEALEEVELA